MSAWGHLRLNIKIPVLVTGAALLLALLLGAVSYRVAEGNARASIEERNAGLLSARASALRDYLSAIEQDLRVLAAAPAVSEALSAFKAGFDRLGSQAEATLHRLYIDENPHPTGRKDELDRAPDTSEYSRAHAQHHPWFRTLLRERAYYDVFLIDADGAVVYSVFKELDFATNVLTGRWRDTDLARVVREVRADPRPGTLRFADFRPYGPSSDAPASFIAAPIVSGGVFRGALVVQMPAGRINELMNQTAGLGETGEVVLVGADGQQRSRSRFAAEDDTLKTRLDHPAIVSAVAGRAGEGSLIHRGRASDLVARPFEFQGVRWAIVLTQSREELQAPIAALRNGMLLTSVGVLILVTLLGFLASLSITRPITALVQDMRRLADGDTGVSLAGAARQDEIGDMTRAVAVFRDNALARERLQSEARAQEEAERRRAERVSALLGDFDRTVTAVVAAVEANATEMETTARGLTGIAESASARASAAAAATEQASANVQTVASAAEELSAAISEISQRIAQANDVVARATAGAQDANTRVGTLANAAARIGQVVSLIRDIADQTNLLALNATIEAARAGEAGRGFAVVASEVKALASQTARATEEIGSQIAGIQSDTQNAVVAIEAIARTMADVAGYTTAIAAAVEEQGAATNEISRNVQQAAGGTSEVSRNMSGVTMASEETRQSSSQVLVAAGDLAAQAARLRAEVTSFLTAVKAA